MATTGENQRPPTGRIAWPPSSVNACPPCFKHRHTLPDQRARGRRSGRSGTETFGALIERRSARDRSLGALGTGPSVMHEVSDHKEAPARGEQHVARRATLAGSEIPQPGRPRNPRVAEPPQAGFFIYLEILGDLGDELVFRCLGRAEHERFGHTFATCRMKALLDTLLKAGVHEHRDFGGGFGRRVFGESTNKDFGGRGPKQLALRAGEARQIPWVSDKQRRRNGRPRRDTCRADLDPRRLAGRGSRNRTSYHARRSAHSGEQQRSFSCKTMFQHARMLTAGNVKAPSTANLSGHTPQTCSPPRGHQKQQTWLHYLPCSRL